VSSFEEFFQVATGRGPHDDQRRLAADGLPGCGSVPGASRSWVILAWLWRRLHGTGWVRESTPRRLVYVLPQGSLVEPVAAEVARWLTGLGLDERVALQPSVSPARQWRRDMHGPAIVIGTADVLVSKALNRGYGVGAIIAPIDFALVTNGAQWVFDEAALCPRSAATIGRLVAQAAEAGTAEPLAASFLSSAEPPEPPEVARLGAEPGDYQAIAAAAAQLHRLGTRTLIVLNSVRAAQRVYAALAGGPVDCVLVHAEFRGRERRALAERVAEPADGQIVVAAPVVDAGLEISAELVVTEVAPGVSPGLRAGRCAPGGRVFWVPGAGTGLQEPGIEPREAFGPQEIFDPPAVGGTGEDLDVAGLVGDGADLEAQLIWASWVPAGRPPEEFRLPGDEWRCRASLAGVAELARRVPVWRLDWARDGWVELTEQEEPASPGELLVVAAADGGYDSVLGFDPGSRAPLADAPSLEPVAGDEGEPAGEWVSLTQHSEETRDQAAALLSVIRPSLSEVEWRSVVCAAYLHDVGKAHPTWQDALCAVALDADRERVQAGRPWAKSGTEGRLVFAGDVTFRHELASLLLVDGPLRALVDAGADLNLVRYLVLAHHGRLRVRVTDPDSAGPVLFGLADGGCWPIPAVLGVGAGELTVDLAPFPDAWTSMVLSLLDRYGPFVLAYLETLVRIADWRASGRIELAV
jgi:CRISPR-associated endonuclease/helicase Cas3